MDLPADLRALDECLNSSFSAYALSADHHAHETTCTAILAKLSSLPPTHDRDRLIVAVLAQLGHIHVQTRNWEQALCEFEESIRIAKRVEADVYTLCSLQTKATLAALKAGISEKATEHLTAVLRTAGESMGIASVFVVEVLGSDVDDKVLLDVFKNAWREIARQPEA